MLTAAYREWEFGMMERYLRDREEEQDDGSISILYVEMGKERK